MEKSEEDIVINIVEGDIQNFGFLYDRYVKKIYEFVYFRTLHQQTAEDLTSLTFMKALKHLRDFDPRKGKFSTWLFSIAKNTLYDHYRTKKNMEELPIELDIAVAGSPQRNFDSSESLRKVQTYLIHLPVEQRDVVIMRVWEGCSYKEIAGIIGKSEAACKMTFARAIAKMKLALPGLVVFLILQSLM